MKTTIDLPEEILHRAKVLAAQRRTTLKGLVLAGLDHVLTTEEASSGRLVAMERMKRGYHLGGTPVNRDQLHERH